MASESDMPPDLAARADQLLRSGIPNADLLAGISADSFEASGGFGAGSPVSPAARCGCWRRS